MYITTSCSCLCYVMFVNIHTESCTGRRSLFFPSVLSFLLTKQHKEYLKVNISLDWLLTQNRAEQNTDTGIIGHTAQASTKICHYFTVSCGIGSINATITISTTLLPFALHALKIVAICSTMTFAGQQDCRSRAQRLDLLQQLTMGERNHISVCTYDMHGYNNGVEYIKPLCNTTDIVFVQEHWLQKSQLYMFNSINDQFMFYGKSAMDEIESMPSGLIKGRPYGGVGVL